MCSHEPLLGMQLSAHYTTLKKPVLKPFESGHLFRWASLFQKEILQFAAVFSLLIVGMRFQQPYQGSRVQCINYRVNIKKTQLTLFIPSPYQMFSPFHPTAQISPLNLFDLTCISNASVVNWVLKLESKWVLRKITLNPKI